MKGYVLIVDDNHVDLKLHSELLQIAGFETSIAADAAAAHVLLQSRVPDLILTDIAMPGMDGLAFTRTIKANARLRHIPVVALTAFAMKGDEHAAMEAGCDAYITKPIDTRRFPEQIGGVLWAAQPMRSCEARREPR